MSKTRIELECSCTTCKTYFIIWNIEKLIGKDVGSGVYISSFTCPNCHLPTLKFDLVRGKVND